MKFLIVCLFAAAYAAPEAEADAEADPALLYGAYGYGGLTHGLTYGAGVPIVHSVASVAVKAAEPVVAEVKTVASPVTYTHAAYPYATYGVNAYAHGVNTYAHAGYPYAYGAYAPYAGYHAVAGPAVASHVVAKRSADAEAEADAHYGYYGPGYGYAPYGRSGYAYGAYPRAYGYYGYGYGQYGR